MNGNTKAHPIPERRPPADERERETSQRRTGAPATFPYPVWRCKVCGYLCARGSPPEICPICKAKKDRFERFV